MMSLAQRRPVRTAASLVLLTAGIGILALTALVVGPGSLRLEAAGMLVGFLVLSLGLLVAPVGLGAATGFALAFTIYGGLSAFAAINDFNTLRDQAVNLAAPFVRLGIGYVPDGGVPGLDAAFRSATQVTIASGIAAVLASGIITMALRGRFKGAPRRPIDSQAVLRVGRMLMLIGGIAVALALGKFVLKGSHGGSPFAAMKSFWSGGTYLLLTASVALPGAGLVLSALIERRAPRRDYFVLGLQVGIFILALVPTGQRTFLLEAAGVALVVLDVRGLLNRRWLALIGCLGVLVLVTTQAVRNDLNDTGSVTPSGFVGQFTPGQLPQLLGGQVASFRWTVEVARDGSQLHIHNDGLAILAKPIPRTLWPGKPEGFSVGLTTAVAPSAAAAHVYFATPLVAETLYTLGPAGAILIHALLGMVIALGVILALRLSPLLSPIALMSMAWTAFVFLRGDASNAEWVASGWLIPTGLALLALRRLTDQPVKRIVVDALQVSPDYSGAGRTTHDIGRGLVDHPLDIPIVLRCARDVSDVLLAAFPSGTQLETPLASARPRWRRLVYQQLLGPLRDSRGTTLLCPADQGPVWGWARVILCVHDVRRLTHPATSSFGDRWFYRTLQPKAIRHADAIFTGSEFSADEIRRVVRPAAPISLVSYHPQPRSTAAIGDGDFLLSVGAIRAYKGLADLLVGFAHVKQRARLVIVGGGSHELDALRQRADELGIADRVEFAGWVSDERLDELYNHALATVQPSTFEGYGLAVAESLARGLPTVVSRIPPHLEIAGEDGALWFAPGDSGDLGRALVDITTNSQLRDRLAQAARARAHSWHRELPWGQAIGSAIEMFKSGDRPQVAERPSRAEVSRRPVLGSRRRFRRPWATGPAALAALGVGALMFAGRGTNFYRDEWYFVVFRNGSSAIDVLSAHAGNLYYTLVGLYLGLFATVGLNHYWVFRLIQSFAVVGLGVGLAYFARRKVQLAGALVIGASVITLGPGWQGILWPFQLAFVCCSAASVAILVLLARPASWRRDLLATAILMVILGFGGESLAVIAGAVVLLGLRRHWHSWVVVTLPIACYLAWYLWLGHRDPRAQLAFSNVPGMIGYVVQAAGAPIAAVMGLPQQTNALLGLALFGLVGYRVVRGSTPPTFWAALVMGLGFWSLLSLKGGGGALPDESRYLLPSLVFVWLIVLESIRPISMPSIRGTTLAGALVAVVMIANYAALLQGGNAMRRDSVAAASELAALEAVGPPLTNAVDPLTNYTAVSFPLPVGTLFEEERKWRSSPSGGARTLRAQPEATRLAADQGVMDTLPRPWTVVGRGTRSCLRSAARGPSGQLVVTAVAPRLFIRSRGPVTIEVRRFASSFSTDVVTPQIPAATRAVLSLPPPAIPGVPPWSLRISWTRPTTLCNLGA